MHPSIFIELRMASVVSLAIAINPEEANMHNVANRALLLISLGAVGSNVVFFMNVDVFTLTSDKIKKVVA